jgi:hypothetical protein
MSNKFCIFCDDKVDRIIAYHICKSKILHQFRIVKKWEFIIFRFQGGLKSLTADVEEANLFTNCSDTSEFGGSRISGSFPSITDYNNVHNNQHLNVMVINKPSSKLQNSLPKQQLDKAAARQSSIGSAQKLQLCEAAHPSSKNAS